MILLRQQARLAAQSAHLLASLYTCVKIHISRLCIDQEGGKKLFKQLIMFKESPSTQNLVQLESLARTNP